MGAEARLQEVSAGVDKSVDQGRLHRWGTTWPALGVVGPN